MDLLGGLELAAAVSPATRFDTRHGDPHGLARRSQDGHVGGPVLLGSDEFFAVEDQDRLLARVFEQEFRDAATFGDLPNAGAARANRGGEGEVVALVAGAAEQGEESEVEESVEKIKSKAK